MGGVDIGGDESVMWHAQGDNLRKDPLLLKHEKHGDFGWLHNAVDEAKGDFTITIKTPADRAALYQRMRAAITASENGAPGTPVTFTLPIEDGHHEQIQVSWISDLTNPHAHRNLAAAVLKSGGSLKRSAPKKKSSGKSKTKSSGKSKKRASPRPKKTSKKR